ncbi:MAG: DUF1592 domain-containing protein [Acidobacteria bacterium]|nr:DUF1592 domain-containing protein [Acidobacteriota bacterium]
MPRPAVWPVVAALLIATPAAAGQAPSAGQASATSAQAPADSAQALAAAEVDGRALLRQYCAACHNDQARTGGLTLEGVDPEHPELDPATFEQVILKLRTGMMPPEGRPRPETPVLAAFIDQLETRLDRAAAAAPNPGRPILHRLNRTEYANAVRDLFGLEIDATSLLPPDDMSQGYDNMSDVLTVSPTLLESYLTAAGRIARMTVGDPDATPSVDTYVVPQAFSQMRHVPGTPFGTRGGVAVTHNFPADGEYVFRLSFYFASIGAFFGDNIPAEGEQIEIAVNGERVALLDLDRKLRTTDVLRTEPIPIRAGPQQISAAFIQRAAGPVQDFVMPFDQALADLSTGHFPGLTGLPHLRNLGIDGPYDVTGVSETPIRLRLLTCRPRAGAPDEETACADEILSRVARRAFRRPLTDGDRTRLLRFYDEGRAAGDHEAGLRMGLQAILADPEFLFRFERTPPGVAPGENHRLTDLELAARLSFFLWSSLPDEALIDVAADGRLSDRAVLEAQVERMLADPRAESLSTNFASHWLRLQNLQDVHPDVFLYPDWDLNLSASMRRETEMLFDSIVRENRGVTDLIGADYTFVDQRLAEHYGVPNVIGNRFRRVPVTDDARRGLLGHASILSLTSLANRTSPVIRGAWVLDVLLGAPPPRPPADIPPLDENEHGEEPATMRERLAAHRASPACASCHRIMDPVGFALENFDPTGAWRTRDGGEPIDPSDVLFDGTAVAGPADIRRFIERHEESFVTNFTRNLLMFALGRILEPTDMPAVREVVRQAAADEHRFSTFVMEIVTSPPFTMRRVDAEVAGAAIQP